MDSMIGRLRDVDIKRLRIFMTIVECGGFAQAQTELGLSASTISVRISELETRLGLRLCQRGRAGFVMTPEGDAVYQACQSLVAAHDRFKSTINSARGIIGGEFRLGVIDNVIFDPGLPVSRALALIFDQASNPEISLYTMAPSELERAIIDRRLHMAIGVFYRRMPALRYQTLCYEKLVLYCGRGHRLFESSSDRIDEAELMACNYVERTYGQTTSRMNVPVPLRVAAYSSSLEATALLILSGRYIGFLPQYYARMWCDKNRMKPINAEHLYVESEVSIATLKTPEDSPSVNKMQRLFGSLFEA